jgi:hypothetical protein
MTKRQDLYAPSMTVLLRCSLLVLGEHQDQQADKQPEKRQRNRLPEEVVHSPHLKPGPTLDRTEGPRYSADSATEGRGAPVWRGWVSGVVGFGVRAPDSLTFG